MSKKQTIFTLIILLFFVSIKITAANENIVEWGELKIPADKETFKPLGGAFFKDKNNVFYFENIIKKADPATFKKLGHSDYSIDKSKVFCKDRLLNDADKNSFSIINTLYAKDTNFVYKNCNTLNEIDSATFTLLEYGYSKDKNNSYYHEKIIPNTDPNSFKILFATNHGIYTNDKNNVYVNEVVDVNILNAHNDTLYNKLKGKIILKTESNGEAYYVNLKNNIIHYLGKPMDAFEVMKKQGVGISNSNLEKIQIDLDNLSGNDSDRDGLSDLLEDSLGTNKNSTDSDNDGYDDKDELEKLYNPIANGKLNLDKNFAKSQNGKILLQVESNGEAWYVNPNNSKRFFLGRPTDAFIVMKNLGLGISNNNFTKLTNYDESDFVD